MIHIDRGIVTYFILRRPLRKEMNQCYEYIYTDYYGCGSLVGDGVQRRQESAHRKPHGVHRQPDNIIE